MTTPLDTDSTITEPTQADARSSRRNLLRLAGAAVVGGTAATLLAQPAAAATGAMQYGAANNAGNAETSLFSSINGGTLMVSNTGGGVAGYGVSTGDGTGLEGVIDTPFSLGFGLWGLSNGGLGYGVVATGGQSQLRLEPGSANGPSLNVLHRAGEIAFDSGTNALWLCTAGGTPGVWRKLAGGSTAGAFHAIVPARVYDSRKAAPGPQSPLATGATRTISVADGRNPSTGAVTTANVVPAGATAISYNLTVVNTVGTNGYLAVNDGGNTTVTASAINWSTAGLTTANGSVVKLNSSRQITVICGGTSTSCNFIIDVVGYYL